MKNAFDQYYDEAEEPGLDVTNDLFAKKSWYFRNALVRANYENAQLDVVKEPVYLEEFFLTLENCRFKHRPSGIFSTYLKDSARVNPLVRRKLFRLLALRIGHRVI